jgi:alpha-1,6-mannosyltransferase
MRIADVTQWFSPTSGGIHTYLRAKAQYASGRALDHAIVVPAGGARSRVFHGSPLIEVPGVLMSRQSGYRLTPRASRFTSVLDELQPDVVVVHDATAHPRAIRDWARANGAAVVMVIHSELESGAAGLTPAVRRPARAVLGYVQDRALAMPDAVIVTSSSLRDRIASRSSTMPVVIPLGVDQSVFMGAAPDPALRAQLAPPEVPLLVHAGRLSSEKRVDLLADMLAELRTPAVLAVAGSGPAHASLKRRAQRLGVGERMVMLGHIADRADLARIMATGDCFVHPNPDETYGLAPLEALATGTRVVAARGGGLRDVLGHRGAVLVEPGNPVALARGVETALMRERSAPDLTDLTWDRTFGKEWDLYKSLTATAQTGPPSAAATLARLLPTGGGVASAA